MRERDAQKKTNKDSLHQLLLDLIKVYVLDSLTMTMSLIFTQIVSKSKPSLLNQALNVDSDHLLEFSSSPSPAPSLLNFLGLLKFFDFLFTEKFVK